MHVRAHPLIAIPPIVVLGVLAVWSSSRVPFETDDPAALLTEQTAVETRIDLNHATVQELQSLPRIGPTLADRIIEYRDERGPFTSVSELDAIKGIGPKTIEALKRYVMISDLYR